MLTTEKEAREKWCPQARVAQYEITSCRCIASACMMWRFIDDPLEWKTVQLDLAAAMEADGWTRDGEPFRGSGLVWFANYNRARQNRVGFCGLAGEPREANLIAELIGSLQITIQNWQNR